MPASKKKDKKEDITKLKTFKMPKKAPNLGGTEADLEGQIEADLFNLNVDTENFGKEAMEAMEAETGSKQPPSGLDAGGDAAEEEEDADEDKEEDMEAEEEDEEDEELAKEMEEISKEVEEEGGMDPAISQAMEEENAEFDSDIQMIEESRGSAKKSKKVARATSKPKSKDKAETAPKPKTQEKRDVPIVLQKARKPKEDPKKKAAREKQESGFAVSQDSAEAKRKAEYRQKTEEANKKLADIKHQKQLKAKEEAEKLKKMNMGAADFMKQQQKEQREAK